MNAAEPGLFSRCLPEELEEASLEDDEGETHGVPVHLFSEAAEPGANIAISFFCFCIE